MLPAPSCIGYAWRTPDPEDLAAPRNAACFRIEPGGEVMQSASVRPIVSDWVVVPAHRREGPSRKLGADQGEQWSLVEAIRQIADDLALPIAPATPH